MSVLPNKNQCTGCTACVNICPQQCIQMEENVEGFLYPIIKENFECISCGLCEEVCPVLNNNQRNLGITKAYAALSKNDKLRMESSSGGVFSEVAKLILQAGGIVYGAGYDNEFKVTHIGIEDVKLLGKLRGAKYSQSDLSSCFQTIKKQLDAERQVLFSGTPCQLAGLKAFLKRDYNNLFCIDFVCHGVPSPLAWKKYVEFRTRFDNNGNVPEYINLRNKETGWSKYSYSVEFAYSREKRYLCRNSEDLFMNLFVNNYILRRSCSDCHFKGYYRITDITLGDFWGIWDIIPEMDDNKGTSLVLTHSEKGEKLFRAIAENIRYRPVTLEEGAKMNPSILKSSLPQQSREKVLGEIVRNGFGTQEKILGTINQERFKTSSSLNSKQTAGSLFIKRIKSALNKLSHK